MCIWGVWGNPRMPVSSVLPFKTRTLYFVSSFYYCVRSSSNLVLSLRLKEASSSVLQKSIKHPGPSACHLCHLVRCPETDLWEKRNYDPACKGLCAPETLLPLHVWWCAYAHLSPFHTRPAHRPRATPRVASSASNISSHRAPL